MIDKPSLAKLASVLSRLSMAITLLDDDGKIVCGDRDRSEPSIPLGLKVGKPQAINGKTWLYTGNPQTQYIVVYGDDAASADCALLACELIQSAQSIQTLQSLHTSQTQSAAAQNLDVNSTLRAVLLDEVQQPMLDAIASDYYMLQEHSRVVMLFFVMPGGAQVRAAELLNELIPLGDDDVLIEMNRSMLALIKSMNMVEDFDELAQFGEAVEQTLLLETATKLKVAIGEPKPQFSQLAESYKEAWRSLVVGRMYKPNSLVYMYRRLALERFLMETPKEIGQRYHGILFNKKTQRLFNEEMLYTIEMFFQKDLNLSDTARQLYIHRNTLVYRLDKVQRVTGFDLRCFEHAIAFRMLYLLGRGGRDGGAARQG